MRFSRRSCQIDGQNHLVDGFPTFQPPLWLRNAHLQTVAGMLFGGRQPRYRATLHRIELPDGDVAFLHEDCPRRWRPTDPAALLIHGLNGCHSSSYMVHSARRLNQAGVRTFRMDMRACGVGEGLSNMPYHAGCSHDLLLALQKVAKLCSASPISLIGFSIGGNIALKLAGEAAGHLPPQLSRLIAFSPPIDLKLCVDGFAQGSARWYDRYLAISLQRHLHRSPSLKMHAPNITASLRPSGQRDFDERYTKTVWGFESVDAFYTETSACRSIANVNIPTLLIASRDDPLVPVKQFAPLATIPSIRMHVTDHGGHLGFIGRSGTDPDRRWMDWRIVDFVTANMAPTWTAAAA